MECNAAVINNRSHICVLDYIFHAADLTAGSDISEIWNHKHDLDVPSLKDLK